MRAGGIRSVSGAFVVVGVLVVLGVGSVLAAGPATVDLSADVDEEPVAVGENVTVRVVVSGASDGVGSYDVSVRSNDTDVAEIVAVEPRGDPFRNVTTVTPDSASVSAIGTDTETGSGVTVAAVTVRTVGGGTANLSVSVDALGNESGGAYTVTDASGVALDVEGDGPSGPVDRADTNDDGVISDAELRTAIVDWSAGAYTDAELRKIIVAWAAG